MGLPTTCNYNIATYENCSWRSALTSLLKLRKSLAGDVAIVCGTGSLAMIASLLCRRIKRRVFFEVMSGDRNPGLDPRWLVHLGFDAIVGQAPPVEKRFCEQFRWRKLSTAIPALPDPLEQFGEIATSSPDYSAGVRAAYFGRLTPHKGVRYLVENWGQLSVDLQSLDIFGTGEQEQELSELIASRQLGDVIRLHGEYPGGAEYIRLLQSHHLLLLPTVGKEGAPLVLLEAMACGVPFVANGVGGIPNYANEDCEMTGGDIAEFAAAVSRQVAKMKSTRFDASRLQELYLRRFSFDSLTGQWQDFLLRVVNQS